LADLARGKLCHRPDYRRGRRSLHDLTGTPPIERPDCMTITDITGKTRLFGILADPIHQVKTPQVMNALFRRHAVDAVLVPMHVAPDGLPALMAGLREMRNFGGFIATVPHKPDMLSFCDETVGDAARIGAVNCVRRESDGRMVGA